MKRGFHWFNSWEWAFILLLVLLILGLASSDAGFNNFAIAGAFNAIVLLLLDAFTVILASAGFVVSLFVTVPGTAFLGLLIIALLLFRSRLVELLIFAAFLLLLIGIIF